MKIKCSGLFIVIYLLFFRSLIFELRLIARAVPDLFFSSPAGAGFGMTNPAGAGARFSN